MVFKFVLMSLWVFGFMGVSQLGLGCCRAGLYLRQGI